MTKKLQIPFYDPLRTYEENYEEGPFGGFAASNAAIVDGKVFKQKGEPKYSYHGHKVYLPFGIPAGPLLNSKYVKAAFEKGFDICVYKTVRSDLYLTHPFPNILSVHVNGELTLEKLKKPLLGDTNFQEPIAITNSFNIPSKKPEIWQSDMKKAIASAGKGQVMIGSFVGTVRPDQTPKEFIEDWAVVAKMVVETGAKIVEADISCPNNGAEGLVCYDLETTKKICKRVRRVIGDTPFILKIGYYQDDRQLEKLAEIANEYADGIAGINTLPGVIVDKDGKQALPGKTRKTGGVCGAPIKWAGIDTVKRLNAIRQKKNYSFTIDGVGGVTTPEDYQEYKSAGADTVFSATGAMWNPYLAQEIKSSLR
jgi:dihydroorotate dehydrogenase (NAD+) catalytic subunit